MPGTGTDIGLSIESLTYVDNAADDSDSIDLTLDAQDSKWLWGWMPQKGATLYPRLLGHDWERPGDERAMDCGLFVVDDVNYSDTPTTLQLGGVSKPSDSNFSETDRKVTWKKHLHQSASARPSRRATAWASPYDAEDYDIDVRRTGRSGQQLLQYAVPELRPGAQGVRPAAVGLRPGGIQGKAGGADLRPARTSSVGA